MRVGDSNFLDKNSPFLQGYTFKLAGKNWIEGDPGLLVFHIVVSYCCKWKMLKRNWNWRNSRLFGTFLSLVKFQLGGGWVLWSPPLWLRLCSNWGKQKRCSQIFREVSGVFQQNFNGSKNSAVLEPRKGQFSRTWGQGLHNVSSRPRTSSRTPPLVANASSFTAGKSCQSWIVIPASISKGRKKEKSPCKVQVL